MVWLARFFRRPSCGIPNLYSRTHQEVAFLPAWKEEEEPLAVSESKRTKPTAHSFG